MSDAVAPEQSSDMLPEVGTVLGDYLLEAIIAEGGMGRVYDAVHTKLGRPVALKMLLPSQAANEDVRKRFFGEARAVNRIQHENLVSVTDFIDDDDKFSYYIMERLPGFSLRTVLEEAGIIDVERSVRILRQLADVLASLHEDHIVHRDLKPENIFIVSQASNPDFVKLIDFGVAQILDKEGELLLPSESHGSLIGTPHYMAPEQAEGKPVDDLADIYAFGVVMFEMLTGRHPIDADDISDLLVMKRSVTPPEASGNGWSFRTAKRPSFLNRCRAAKTKMVVRIVRRKVGTAIKGCCVACGPVPGSAADDPLIVAIAWSLAVAGPSWLDTAANAAAFLVARRVPIVDPLPGIAGHVVETVLIGR
ncbi:MAG: hypothetical protein A2289_22620 [Deltaproteobacteria bacterium RIFOXYA12_FULL_58_15]|nr:MAG: hypothetical protein A2289_22620 [Deltaproteobacteria bacterium RIFOXYA12_FULL_58_15]OGR07546.1 MAG: hypothetical protein A2341_11745 [Deltaproteobacteria bacterium RIFOXYB12_FULL_58_9]